MKYFKKCSGGIALFLSLSSIVLLLIMLNTGYAAPLPTQVKDINVVSGDSSEPQYLTDVNGTLFFVANDGSHGIELWNSDGTSGGTVMVKDINPGDNLNLEYFANVNGTLYFGADDGSHGNEL